MAAESRKRRVHPREATTPVIIVKFISREDAWHIRGQENYIRFKMNVSAHTHPEG